MLLYPDLLLNSTYVDVKKMSYKIQQTNLNKHFIFCCLNELCYNEKCKILHFSFIIYAKYRNFIFYICAGMTVSTQYVEN